MWVSFVICLITIPVFFYYDNRQISEDNLFKIDNLTLAQNPNFTEGKRPRININLTNTKRTLVVNLEELTCVNKDEILNNFKTTDTISIKIFSSDKADFYKVSAISKFQKIYGLNKHGRQFIELSCRNLVSTKKTIAAIYASGVTAILSFILAVFVFIPKAKFATKGIIYSDPITVISFCWFLIMILALLILR